MKRKSERKLRRIKFVEDYEDWNIRGKIEKNEVYIDGKLRRMNSIFDKIKKNEV